MPALFFQFFGLPIKAKAVKEEGEKGKRRKDKGPGYYVIVLYTIIGQRMFGGEAIVNWCRRVVSWLISPL